MLVHLTNWHICSFHYITIWTFGTILSMSSVTIAMPTATNFPATKVEPSKSMTFTKDDSLRPTTETYTPNPKLAALHLKKVKLEGEITQRQASGGEGKTAVEQTTIFKVIQRNREHDPNNAERRLSHLTASGKNGHLRQFFSDHKPIAFESSQPKPPSKDPKVRPSKHISGSSGSFVNKSKAIPKSNLDTNDINSDKEDQNFLPTATANLKEIYGHNFIPMISKSEAEIRGQTDVFGTITTPFKINKNNDDAHKSDHGNASRSEMSMGMSENLNPNNLFELDEYIVPEIDEIVHAKTQEMDSPLLKMQLNNEGHSVLVTWDVLNNISQISAFVVSYKMEGREDYDSSKLRKQVRKFILHSLHEDKHYSICVIALVNDTQAIEVCESWSRASSKMVMGIVAGSTLMVPCIIFIVYITYKDKNIRHKMRTHMQRNSIKESKRCLLDADGAKIIIRQSNLQRAQPSLEVPCSHQSIDDD